jgi:hypothetical protein
MLYKVALESATVLKVSLVAAAAMLAICLLAFVGTKNKAEAKDSLPENGTSTPVNREPGVDRLACCAHLIYV